VFAQAKNLGGSAYLPLAHHPHCDRHSHHLVWLRGRPLCLGCCAMISGIAIGLATVAWAASLGLSWLGWGLLFAVLLVPTGLQPWLQNKLYKFVSRSLLGLCIAWCSLGVLWFIDFPQPVLLVRGGVLVLAVVLYQGLHFLRNRRPDNPCTDCPLGTYPTCDWNLPRLMGETHDPILQAAFQQRLDELGQERQQLPGA